MVNLQISPKIESLYGLGYPGYQRFFSRVVRIWIRAGHNRDMTDTGNRARKTSGTQGTPNHDHWAKPNVLHFCAPPVRKRWKPFQSQVFVVLPFRSPWSRRLAGIKQDQAYFIAIDSS